MAGCLLGKQEKGFTFGKKHEQHQNVPTTHAHTHTYTHMHKGTHTECLPLFTCTTAQGPMDMAMAHASRSRWRKESESRHSQRKSIHRQHQSNMLGSCFKKRRLRRNITHGKVLPPNEPVDCMRGGGSSLPSTMFFLSSPPFHSVKPHSSLA